MADFEKLLDASLLVLRRTVLEAHAEAGGSDHLSRQSVQEATQKLEGQLNELKNSWQTSRVSFVQGPSEVDFSGDEDAPFSQSGKESTCSEKSLESEPPDTGDEEQEIRKAMLRRLQVRLNVLSQNQLITGRNLHDAVGALGLTAYNVEDMNEMVYVVAKYIGLRIVNKEDPKILRSGSSKSLFSMEGTDITKAIWRWPILNRYDPASDRISGAGQDTMESKPSEDGKDAAGYTVVPAKALMDLFTTKDAELPKRIFTQRLLKQFQAMREILVAGDTNRLVAELTFVRINDLAAPPESLDALFYIEPVVAVLILVNGIMIGFQTDPTYENWNGWPYIEVCFAILLILECFVRYWLTGVKNFFCGPDWHWNLFDIFLVMTAVTDVAFQLVLPDQEADIFGASLLRFCRLIRLVRVVKVFRLNYMKELRLMVKGLVGGIRTLLLSFALLFAVLYVISGFATMTLGRDMRIEELSLSQHFDNIPRSMFTAFRCFSGECFADSGLPIAAVLSSELGFSFVLCYVVCYMLVSMGIFNVILAVYVDITMRAAKETEISTAEQYSRESIRIARTTRELLKKFAEAHRLFYDREEGDRGTIRQLGLRDSDTFMDDDISDTIAITKELFLLVIQDQRVQHLMNDLDLPTDRANLFEVIDADGTGTLNVTELVQGLLKIRGDLSKSDTVAVLLTTKAIYRMVHDLHLEQQNFRETLLDIMASTEALRKSISGVAGVPAVRKNPRVNNTRRGNTQASKEPKPRIRSLVSDPVEESSDEKYNQPVADEVKPKANVVSLG